MQARYAFIQINVSSKGRPTLTRSLFGFMMEVFERTIGGDLRSRGRARGAGGCRFSDRLENIKFERREEMISRNYKGIISYWVVILVIFKATLDPSRLRFEQSKAGGWKCWKGSGATQKIKFIHTCISAVPLQHLTCQQQSPRNRLEKQDETQVKIMMIERERVKG